MPNIGDIAGADTERKFMDVLRILFQMYRDFASKLYDSAKTNDALKTYYKFMDKLEEHYDLNTGEAKKQGAKEPFDISKCKTFATNEILKAFDKAGIDYMMVTKEGVGPIIVTPSDDVTRTRINKIKFEAFQKYAVSAQLTSAELFADNAGRDILRFEGFTADQVQEFNTYAQEKGFLFAAPQNEHGTYTIEISRFTAEQPAFYAMSKLTELAAFNSKGMEAELNSLYSHRKAELIDNALAELKASDPSKAISEKIYIIDAQNPTNYISLQGDAVTIPSTNGADKVVRGGKECEHAFFQSVSDMMSPTQITESQFRAMYAQDAISPAARMQFAQVSYNLTKAQMNAHLLNTMEQRLATKDITIDMPALVSQKMMAYLEQSDKVQDKMLLDELRKSPMTESQLRSMLEKHDSIQSSCINDFVLGRNFNEAFEKAVESIVAEQVMNERAIKEALKESKKINLANITAEDRQGIMDAIGIKDDISIAMADAIMDDISTTIAQPQRPEMVHSKAEANLDLQDVIDSMDDIGIGDSSDHFEHQPDQFNL